MGETVGEIAVVREHEGTRRVDVEPADRDDARIVADEVDDRRPALRIPCRRDDSERLVQEHVRETLLPDLDPVHLDDVARRDECAQLSGDAVDPDATRP